MAQQYDFDDSGGYTTREVGGAPTQLPNGRWAGFSGPEDFPGWDFGDQLTNDATNGWTLSNDQWQRYQNAASRNINPSSDAMSFWGPRIAIAAVGGYAGGAEAGAAGSAGAAEGGADAYLAGGSWGADGSLATEGAAGGDSLLAGGEWGADGSLIGADGAAGDDVVATPFAGGGDVVGMPLAEGGGDSLLAGGEWGGDGSLATDGFSSAPSSTFPTGGAPEGTPFVDTPVDSGWNQGEFDRTNPWNMDQSSTPDAPNFLQRAWNNASKSPFDTATRLGGLGLSAYGIMNQRRANTAAANEIKNIGGTQRDIGNDLINLFKSGTLSPADKLRIDDWERTSTAQVRNFYAKAGIGTSTQAMHAEQTVKERADAMRSQALLATLKTGLDALNVTDKYQLEAIKAQLAGDQHAMQNITAFMNAYGNLYRTQGATTGTGSTPP